MSLQPINSPTTWKRAQTSINANFTALFNAVTGPGTVDATDPVVTALLTDNGSGAYTAVEGIVEDVADGVVEGLVTGSSDTRDALDDRYAEQTVVGRSLDQYGTDTTAVSDAIDWAKANNGRILGTPGATYTVQSQIAKTTAAGETVVLDFRGATLSFAEANAAISFAAPAAFLNTTTSAGLTRRGTKFTVASAAGVQVGDLVTITSPVVWTGSVNLKQTYVVADVDTTTGEVWVEGRIVGDITPAQVSASPTSGDITVAFYRPGGRLEIRNATITSPDKDAAATLISVAGFREVIVDNVHIDKPTRSGIAFDTCGVVRITNCTVSGHGYTWKDYGYTSSVSPSPPGGNAYGYGFLVTNTWLAHARGCHSYSGWHGFDAAVGTSYALFDGCFASKDAFGYSTHEGAWVMHVKGCTILGGNGITSRAAELIVEGTRIETSLGTAISGVATHQRLVIKDTAIDVSAVSGGAAAFAFTESLTYPEYCYSSTTPTVHLANVTITGVSTTSTVASRGDFLLENVTVTPNPAATGSTALRLYGLGSGRALTIKGVLINGVGTQYGINVYTGFTKIRCVDSELSGTVGTFSQSALVNLLTVTGASVSLVNCKSSGAQYICRVTSTDATLDVYDCTNETGLLVLAGDASTVRNAIHNRVTNDALVAGGTSVTLSEGNVEITT